MRWDFQQHCQNPLFICWKNGKIGIFDFLLIFLIKSNLNKCFNFQLEKSTFFINNQTKFNEFLKLLKLQTILKSKSCRIMDKILLEIPLKELFCNIDKVNFVFFHWLIWLWNFSQGIFSWSKNFSNSKKSWKFVFRLLFALKIFHLNSSSRFVTKRYSYNLEKWKTFNFQRQKLTSFKFRHRRKVKKKVFRQNFIVCFEENVSLMSLKKNIN